MSDFPLTVTGIISEEYRRAVLSVTDNQGCEFEYSLRRTDQLINELIEVRRAYEPWRCEHEQSEIRSKFARNGREMVAPQCLRCGREAGYLLKKVNWPEYRPPWDQDLEEIFKRALDEPRRLAEIATYQKHLLIQQEEARRYENYLQSPQWRQKRQIVLERDNHRCQGCGQQRATQVHHRTYHNIYREFLFELISVCDECHARLHENREAA